MHFLLFQNIASNPCLVNNNAAETDWCAIVWDTPLLTDTVNPHPATRHLFVGTITCTGPWGRSAFDEARLPTSWYNCSILRFLTSKAHERLRSGFRLTARHHQAALFSSCWNNARSTPVIEEEGGRGAPSVAASYLRERHHCSVVRYALPVGMFGSGVLL